MWKLAGLFSVSALVLMTVPALVLAVVFADSDLDRISGTVRYMDGEVELPMGACVEVVLVDVSADDAVAIAKGRQVIDDVTTLPIDFSVTYHEERLTPGHRHELWVAVRHEGELLYLDDGEYPVEPGSSVTGIDVAVGPPANP